MIWHYNSVGLTMLYFAAATLLDIRGADAIPSPPSKLCVSGLKNEYFDKVYDYNSTMKIWANKWNDSVVIRVGIDHTWYLSYYKDMSSNMIDESGIRIDFAYCQEYDYFPNINQTYVGNPADCESWSLDKMKVTTNLNQDQCVEFITKLDVFDWIQLVICIIISIIILAFMLPCSKYNEMYCLNGEYDVISIETYKNILTLKSMSNHFCATFIPKKIACSCIAVNPKFF